MLPAIMFFTFIATISVIAFLHHVWRVNRTLSAPSGLRAAGADSVIGLTTGIAWFVAVSLIAILTPPDRRPGVKDTFLLLFTVSAMAIYAVRLVPYALARSMHPKSVRSAIDRLNACTLELVMSAHRAESNRSAVARTTLVVVTKADGREARFPIVWAERAADRTLIKSMDPQIVSLAAATGLPTVIVRDEGPIAPLLGAPLPP